ELFETAIGLIGLLRMLQAGREDALVDFMATDRNPFATLAAPHVLDAFAGAKTSAERFRLEPQFAVDFAGFADLDPGQKLGRVSKPAATNDFAQRHLKTRFPARRRAGPVDPPGRNCMPRHDSLRPRRQHRP